MFVVIVLKEVSEKYTSKTDFEITFWYHISSSRKSYVKMISFDDIKEKLLEKNER